MMPNYKEVSEFANRSFPITAADGVHVHFLEDSVSLLFYATRAIPDNGNAIKIVNKKEMIADIRISFTKAKRLFRDLKTGIENQPFNIVKNMEMENDDLDTKAVVDMLSQLENLSDENKEKAMKLVFQSVADKAALIKELVAKEKSGT